MEFKTEMNLQDYLRPYSADLAIALAFGVGYLIFRTIKKQVPTFTKDVKLHINQSLCKWSNAKSITKFSQLIMNNNDPNFSSFDILEKMGEAEVAPNISIYNCLLSMSLRLNRDEDAARLFQIMKESLGAVQPDIVTYNIMIKAAIKNLKEYFTKEKAKQALSSVESLISDLNNRGLTHDKFTSNTIIDAFVELGELDLAWDWIEKNGKGEKYNVYTYTSLIKGLKNSNNEKSFDKIMEIFEIMKNSKSEHLYADEFAYNSVMDSCIKFNKISLVGKILNDMKQSGIKPSLITYSIYIKSLAIEGKLDEILEIKNKLKQEGIAITGPIYDSMLSCAIKLNNFSEIKLIFNSMIDENVEPNTIIMANMIKNLAKAKHYELAFAAFDHLLSVGLEGMDIVLLNTILDCSVESKNFEKMSQVYSIIKLGSSEPKLAPTVVTYSTLLKGYTKMGKEVEAEELYEYCKSKLHGLDEVFFNTMADYYGKLKRESKALLVLKDMKERKVIQTSVIYSILIKMYSQMGEDTKTLELYREMKRDNINPTLITSTSIMQMFIKQKKLDSAIQLFCELRSKTVSLDSVTYNFIINGCSFNKKLEKAIEFLIDSLKKGLILPNNTYNNVLDYLINNKFMKPKERSEFAKEILSLIKEKNITIQYEIYSKLAKLIYSATNSNQQAVNKKSNFQKEGK